MKIIVKTVLYFSVPIVLLSQSALADRVVCKPFKNNSNELSYVISDNPSRRLVGEINLGVDQFSGTQVAQYKTSNRELYLVLDDPETNSYPVLRLEANKYRKQQFIGKLTQYLGSVKISSSHVLCRLNAD